MGKTFPIIRGLGVIVQPEERCFFCRRGRMAGWGQDREVRKMNNVVVSRGGIYACLTL